MNCSHLERMIEGKNVLFITTKNLDYIRNTQELRILHQYAKEVDVLCSSKKNNIFRILEVWLRLTRKKVQWADVVFIGFEPQFVVPFKKRILKGKIVIADFFISVYDTLVWDRKKVKDKTVLSNFCHKMDEITMQRADLIISDTKVHGDYFIQEFDGKNKLIETIYLEADPTIYYPRKQDKPDELKDKFVVLYFGSILPLQGVNVVLDAIREFAGHQEIYFDIIGTIPAKYNKPIQDNVRYTDWLPQEELATSIANADLCLAGHFNAGIEKARRTIPGKAYIYELMEKTMILGDGEANHELYSEDARHKFVKMGSAHNLFELIMKIYQEQAG